MAQRNPFDHLIPQNGVQGANNFGAPRPPENAPGMVQNNPFMHLVPQNQEQTPMEKPQETFSGRDFEKLPFVLRQVLRMTPSFMKPQKQQNEERLAATGRGLKDIGEGLKQYYLLGKEAMGFAEPGTSKQYTKEKDAERKLYETTGAGRDPYSQFLRETIKSAPLTALSLPLRAGTLLKQMAGSGATLGVIKGTEYTPEGKSRMQNVKTGVLEGAALPLALRIPGAVERTISGTGKLIKNALPDFMTGGKVASAKGSMATTKTDMELAKEAHEAARAIAERETKISTPGKMEYALNKARGDLGQIKSAGKSNTPINPEEVFAQHEAEQKHLSSVDKEIGSHLNQGAVHKNEAARGLTRRVESIEKYWKGAYGDFNKKIKDLKINMPEHAIKSYETDMSKILEAVKNGQLDKVKKGMIGREVEQNPYLAELMDKAPTAGSKKASEFIDKFQDFKNARYELSQDLKHVKTREERKQIREALKEASKVEASAQKALDEGLGGHAEELRRINQGYSEQVHPLRENPIVRKALKGKLPENIIDAIGSNEKGMALVRDLVKQDPELMRNVVGQRYARNAEELMNPHAGMREYLNEMPELGKLLEQKRGALTRTESSANRVKEATVAQKKQGEMMVKRQKLEQEIASYEKNLPALKKAAERKDVSLKEHIKAKKEYERVKAQKAKARKILFYTGAAIAAPSTYKTGKALLYSGMGGDNG